MPVVGHLLDFEHRDRMRPHKGVQPVAEAVRSEVTYDIDMRGHGERVNPRVGAARRGERGQLARHLVKRFFQRLLDGRSMLLPLPPHEGPAVIFDGQPPARHRRTLPLRTGKPRKSSAGDMGARPARCTFSG